MSASQVRWGILGTNQISKIMAKAIHESRYSELVAIGSRSLAKAQVFANEFHVTKLYDDYAAMLADPDIDAIYIGLPNHLHKEWVIRCAEAGKHILCEKPFVTNLQDAQEAFAAVKKANVFCMEALMYRCHPLTTKLAELMETKVLGDIRFINAIYTADIVAEANPTQGGSILNLGCYPVSLVRLLAGRAHGKHTAEPTNVVSVGEIDMKTNNPHSASVLMQFPMQMMATVSTTDNLEMYSQLDVYGTEGHLSVKSNPWKPEQKNNLIIIKQNNAVAPTEIIVDADQSLYSYQFDVASQRILKGDVFADVDGISWLDSLGNIVVLEAWQNQVMAKAEAI